MIAFVWHITLNDDKLEHAHHTNHFVSNIEQPTEALLCRNANYTSYFHAIECFIQVLQPYLKCRI